MTTLKFTSLETSGHSEDVNADLYVTDLRARCIAPADGALALSTTPILTMRQEDAANRDIQIQVASDAAFTTVVWSTTLTNVAPLTNVTVTLGVALTNGSRYWWRVRAVDTGGPTYGPYESRSFVVALPVNAAGYETVVMNIGPLFVPTKDDYESVLTNVGPNFIRTKDDYHSVLMNIGVFLQRTSTGYEYVLVGDVDTSTPEPHIWGLMPTAGRPGDGFIIVGLGFGDLQSTYTSDVQIDLGDGSGWQTVGVVDWQMFPADPPMYGPDRQIDLVYGIIDPQHQEIQILIPVDALPPGLVVRVRTNGP